MLVLNRHKNESVTLIHGDVVIEVKIISVSGKRVGLGFDAPKEVRILRKELEVTNEH